MFKRTLLFVLLSTSLSVGFAESIFFTPPAQKTVSTPKVLTPEEFKQQVANLNKQNQLQIKTDASKMIPPPAPSKPIPKPPTTPTSTTGENSDKTNSTTVPEPPKPSPLPSTLPPAPTPAQTTPNNSAQPEETAPAAPIAPASQNQQYTGFQATPPATNTTAPTTNGTHSNTGWNIKY